MKKSKIILMVGVLSLTILSFTSENSNNITRLENGNYVIENVEFSPADEATLNELQEEISAANRGRGFAVRHKTKGEHKFSESTIFFRTEGDFANSDDIRNRVDTIMEKYMN